MLSHIERRKKWTSVDWRKTNHEISEETGYDYSYVAHKRKLLGKKESPKHWKRRPQYTPAKIAVLALKAAGHRHMEIARILGISRQAVDQKVNSDKALARSKIRYLIKKNPSMKPTRCEQYRNRRQLTTHHLDYSKPLDVQWLCWSCHRKAHRNGKH